MTYLKRFGLASSCTFLVLSCLSLALTLPSLFGADVLRALLYGLVPCSVISGLVAAGLVRNNPVVMVITSQLVAIAIIGVVRNL